MSFEIKNKKEKLNLIRYGLLQKIDFFVIFSCVKLRVKHNWSWGTVLSSLRQEIRIAPLLFSNRNLGSVLGRSYTGDTYHIHPWPLRSCTPFQEMHDIV